MINSTIHIIFNLINSTLMIRCVLLTKIQTKYYLFIMLHNKVYLLKFICIIVCDKRRKCSHRVRKNKRNVRNIIDVF